jgi:hypothetical protein
MLAATMRRVVTPSMFLPFFAADGHPPRSGDDAQPQPGRPPPGPTGSGNCTSLAPRYCSALWSFGVFGHERKCETQRRFSLLAALAGLE